MTFITEYMSKEMSVTQAPNPADYGNGEDKHHPIGRSVNGAWIYRSLFRFNTGTGTIPAGAKLVSATLKMKTTASTQHASKGSNVRVAIRQLTASFDPSIGNLEVWQSSGGTTGFPGGVNLKEFAAEGQHQHSTIYEYNIIDLLEAIAHSGVLKRDGSPCDGDDNFGFFMRSYDEGAVTRSTEFQSVRSSYAPRVVIEYTTEAAPEAPVLEAPLGTLAALPTLFSFDFPVDDTADKYTLLVGTTDGSSDILNKTDSTDGMAGLRVDAPVGAAVIPLGQTVYWNARGQNSSDVNGPWGSGTFYVNPTPVVTIDEPTEGGLSFIHNLGAAEEWTGLVAEAQLRARVAYTHPTGLAASAWEYRIDGGVATAIDPGVVQSGGSAALLMLQKVSRDTAFSVEVRAQAGGVWSEWSTLVNTRVNFGQGIWNFPGTVGAGSLTALNESLQGGGAAQVAYLFRSVTLPSTFGPWMNNLSEVTPGDGGVDVLVRLSSEDVGADPALPSFGLEYDTTGDVKPDHWDAAGATLSLDAGFRRFGVHSLKVSPGATGYARNTRALIVSGDTLVEGVPTPTQYTASVFLHTLGKTLTSDVRMAVWDGAGNLIGEAAVGGDGRSASSVGEGKEDWQRLTATFPISVTEVYVGVTFDDVDDFRIDSIQLEEGPLASQWAPGGLGPAVVVDVGGIAVDAQVGGIFRLKSSLGHITQLIDHGLITTRHRAVGEDPRQLGMFWRGEWVSAGDYKRDDTVVDGSYLMVANKDTNDRAAPQPSGAEFWHRLDTPPWTEQAPVKSQYVLVQRFTATQDLIWRGIRYHPDLDPPDPNLRYDLTVVVDPLGDPVSTVIASGLQAGTSEWLEVAGLASVIIRVGETYDIVLRVWNNAGSITKQGVYDYRTPPKTTAPGIGEVIHSNDDISELRIHNIDQNATDWRSDFDKMLVGDTIQAHTYNWEVLGFDRTDPNYTIFTVRPQVQASSDGIVDFIFTSYQPGAITYVEEVGALSAADSFHGDSYELAVAGASGKIGYGLDIKVQAIVASDDWDIVSTAGGGGGSSGAEVVPQCVLVKESVQAIANGTPVTLAWLAADAEHDPLGMVGTNEVVIPATAYPGLWEVEVVNKWQNNSNGERRLDISHGGSMVNRQVIPATVNTATSSAVKHTKRLTADTTVASTIQQGSGGSLDSNYLMVKATRIAT